MKIFSFRNLRILTLLVLLAVVAIYSKGQRLYSTAWLDPLPVVIFPINADGLPETGRYIRALDESHFSPIDDFMAREGKKFQLLVNRPTQIHLGPQVEAQPPEPPGPGSAGP